MEFLPYIYIYGCFFCRLSMLAITAIDENQMMSARTRIRIFDGSAAECYWYNLYK